MKDKISDLKKVIEKWTYSKVILDQLLFEQVPGNIVKALGGRCRRKEEISTKEVVFTKAGESSFKPIPEITSDSEFECETQEPLPPLPKLIGAEPKRTKNKSPAIPNKKADSSTDRLLLTLMEEVKGSQKANGDPFGTSPSNSQSSSSKSTKQKTWFRPCKHCGLRNHLTNDCNSKPNCSTCGSLDHLTKEHIEQNSVNKTLTTLKAQLSVSPSTKKALMIPKPFKECKYCGFNDHHYDNCEYYPGCEKDGNLNKVRVKELRSDNEIEFRNHKLEEFCDEKGISQNFSSPCTPEQNGVAERRNKTLIKAARTMLNSAKLPKQFWGEAVNTACYTQNRSIIVKRHGKTAYDVFRGRSLDISYFHVFKFPVYIHNHRGHLGKFDEKADDGFFFGYSLLAKAFKVFNIRRQEMEEIIHVTFSEDDEAIS
ncbi:retrovirus-related pol polyprotein from transposon TNT 1-94 [Tanacetum coccineum]